MREHAVAEAVRACGDRHPAPHEANLFDMDAKYADVVSEADAVASLETRAAPR